jgi:hypothetical protein
MITATALLAICSAANSTGDAIPSAIADQVDPASVRVYEFQGANLWLPINGADGKPTRRHHGRRAAEMSRSLGVSSR